MTNVYPDIYSKEYIDDLDFIGFSNFESWDLFTGYAYEISNQNIRDMLDVLKDTFIKDLVLSELDRDWQDAKHLEKSFLIPDHLKHAARVAGLVLEIPKKGVNAILIDTFSSAPSCVEGHHRLLALKYMGYTHFPASLSGYCDLLSGLNPVSVLAVLSAI